MKALLITTLFIYSLQLFAKDDYCTPVRLDQDPDPSMMKHVPVVEQALGTCYAHAAAQLMDAYRFSHEPPKGDKNYNHHTFSLDLALKSKDNWLHRNITGWFFGKYKNKPDAGFICDAYNAGAKSGRSCSKEAMLKKAGVLAGWDPNVFPHLMQDNSNLEWYMEKLKDLYNHRDEVKQDSYRNCYSCRQNNPEFKSLMDIVKVMKKGKDNELAFYADIVDKHCGENVQKINKDTKCKTRESYRRDKEWECERDKFVSSDSDECDDWTSNLDIIHEKIGKQPVGIEYCSKVLTAGKKYDGLNFLGIPSGDCGGHASLVIGRRRVGKSCQLLVRNSWGTSCNAYSNDFNCENGNIWVDEKVLEKNIMDVTFIEDKE